MHETTALSPEALDFAPGLLAIQENPPARLPRTVMYSVVALCLILLVWAVIGKLDIIASAEGRLIPQTYVKIVQPADGGIVQDILVKEGERVTAGQILMRMDTQGAKADESILRTQLAMRSLQLRRIEAELKNLPLAAQAGDQTDLYRQTASQYRERRQAYLDSLNQAQEAYNKAQHDYASGKEVLIKLREVLPILKHQAEAYTAMGQDGYVPKLAMMDKQRDYVEKAQDLRAQESNASSLAASVAAAIKQVAQITSKYRSDLENERIDAEGQYRKLQQDWVKQEHKSGLLELRALQAGVVKDMATHTAGSVVAPGTVLLSLVPESEPLIAEVMVRNDDVGFIHPHQKVKLKLATYPFQKYGMLDGEIVTVGADASDGPDKSKSSDQTYKALVSLQAQSLLADGERFKLVAGMQVIAEINEGRRTVMEYLLSPVQKVLHESGRER